MTTPIGRDIGIPIPTMRDAVIDFLLVGVCLVVRFADTLRDDFRVALSVASVFAVGALHASSILQEVAAKSTTHDIVELLCDELVTLLFVDFLLSLPDCTLTVETYVERSSILQLFR
jgi:hypothetical protein